MLWTLMLGLALGQSRPETSDLLASCIGGDNGACNLLAIRHRESPGQLRRVCEAGDDVACLELASWHAGEPQQLDARVEACRDKVGEQCLQAGFLLLQRLSGQRDPEQGRALVDEGCTLDTPGACRLSRALRPLEVVVGPEQVLVSGRPVLGLQGGRLPLSEDGQITALAQAVTGPAVELREAVREARGPAAFVPGTARLHLKAELTGAELNALLESLASRNFADVELHSEVGGKVRAGMIELPLQAASLDAASNLENLDDDRQAAITRVLEVAQPALQGCYRAVLPYRPSLSGRIIVDFTIAPDGRVARALIGLDALGDQSTAACVLQQVRSLRFPPPKDGQPAAVSYPIRFTP